MALNTVSHKCLSKKYFYNSTMASFQSYQRLCVFHNFGGIGLDLWPIPVIFIDNACIISGYLSFVTICPHLTKLVWYRPADTHIHWHTHTNSSITTTTICEIKMYFENIKRLLNSFWENKLIFFFHWLQGLACCCGPGASRHWTMSHCWYGFISQAHSHGAQSDVGNREG